MKYSYDYVLWKYLGRLATNYPVIYWIVFCIIMSLFLYIFDFNYIKNNKKRDILFLIFMICWLIWLTVYKSNGWLIYPCIVAYILIFGIIIYKYYIFKKDKIENSCINQKTKISNLSPTKPKKQQKPNKQKDVQKSNFKKYKLINKNRVKDKNNN
ncbi:hypothetical protein [Campylobacter ureolyticus]|uniref:Membrane protein n=1 Tax=Campylobacter ureolyticus TaxID=827 RepID=A0AAE7JQ56_9BACT|nr:hypothetical protein [Campylobacter ureolyticus]MCR8685655.1 V-type ATPase subunit a family protein [Campylobacter ureolyticus]QKF85103.1 putative membrane protein [Campylobacter ureolyticus]SUX25586.1 Uncharacterised protein [Campylobacter ureolyticus]